MVFKRFELVKVRKCLDSNLINKVGTVLAVYLTDQQPTEYEVEFLDGYVHIFREEHLCYPDKTSTLLYV